MVWSCMLYFTSIDIAITTKRNIVAAAVPVICLLAQKSVTKIRLLTSEPAEHYFGCARQKKREFTVSDFITYVESLEDALREMVEFNLRSGCGSGYGNTLSGFLRYFTQELSSNDSTVSNESTESVFVGVDVDYGNPLLSVSARIESEVTRDINTSTQSVVAFLRDGLNVTTEDISPSAKKFTSMMELAHVYYYYLSPDTRAQLEDHVFSPPVSECIAQKEADEYDDIATEEANETLQYAVNFALDDVNDNDNDVGVQSKQFIPHGLQRSLSLNQNENDDDDESICSWKTLNQVMKEVIRRNMHSEDSTHSFIRGILSIVSACMKKANQRLNVSTSDDQKYKSLKGRWWGESETIASSEREDASVLKRGMMFRYNSRIYKIVNIFKKSYNKWRLETHGAAEKTTKLQAVSIVEDRMIPNAYRIDGSSDRKVRCILLSGDKVVPFAAIVSQGWIDTVLFS